MGLRLEAVPKRVRVPRLDPIVLAVRLVNDSGDAWSAEHHMLTHAPFPKHVWWEARLGDGRLVTNLPRGDLEFDLVCEEGLQVEPEPPDWVVIGASNASGVVQITIKEGLFALEAAVRVTVR